MHLRKALVGCRALSTAEGVIRCLSKATLPSDRQKCELRQSVSGLRTLDTFRKRQITTTSPFMHLRSSGMEAHKISKCVHTNLRVIKSCEPVPRIHWRTALKIPPHVLAFAYIYEQVRMLVRQLCLKDFLETWYISKTDNIRNILRWQSHQTRKS
jgi:hypothetical protein